MQVTWALLHGLKNHSTDGTPGCHSDTLRACQKWRWWPSCCAVWASRLGSPPDCPAPVTPWGCQEGRQTVPTTVGNEGAAAKRCTWNAKPFWHVLTCGPSGLRQALPGFVVKALSTVPHWASAKGGNFPLITFKSHLMRVSKHIRTQYVLWNTTDVGAYLLMSPSDSHPKERLTTDPLKQGGN